MPEETTFFGEFEPIARRELPLFFLIDKSGSMTGSKIGVVNTTMRELLEELQGAGEADSDIKLAILAFSSGCEWLTPAGLQSPEKIMWTELEANGLTDLGEACIELSKKMSRKEFMQSASSTFAPIVILLSDGDPTDNYKKGIETLRGNKWFTNALVLALPIGTDVNLDILAEFTGNKEAVLKPVTNAAELKKMMKTVSITAAQIGSQSYVNAEDDDGKTKLSAFLDVIKDAEDEPALDGGVDPDKIKPDDEDW